MNLISQVISKKIHKIIQESLILISSNIKKKISKW